MAKKSAKLKNKGTAKYSEDNIENNLNKLQQTTVLNRIKNMNVNWVFVGVTAAAAVAILTAVFVTILQNSIVNNQPTTIDSIKGTYTILDTYNIDSRYFFQGLEFIDDSHLLMSEGWYGSSALGVMNLDSSQKTVSIAERYPINSNYFGEGATYYPKDSRIYMLTWRNNAILVYDGLNSLKPTFLKEIPLPSEIQEGWGLTHDANYLYISNGSTKIFVCVPNQSLTGLDIVRTIQVDTLGKRPSFNEIEARDGLYIYANSFLTNEIYKFKISDGSMVGFWDIPELLQRERTYVQQQGQSSSYDWSNNVLNGIAYNSNKQTFLLTGKRWDFMFEVDLKEKI